MLGLYNLTSEEEKTVKKVKQICFFCIFHNNNVSRETLL